MKTQANLPPPYGRPLINRFRVIHAVAFDQFIIESRVSVRQPGLKWEIKDSFQAWLPNGHSLLTDLLVAARQKRDS
jgi:hypothetical protein